MQLILSESQIEYLLSNQVHGRIGCSDNGKTYIVPVNYAYDGKYVYAHSKEGRKIEIMRRNGKVCFEVDYLDPSGSWQSVIAWGIYEELKTVKEQVPAMKIFIDRMVKLIPDEGARPTHGSVNEEEKVNDPFKAIVFRILVTEKTGRSEVR